MATITLAEANSAIGTKMGANTFVEGRSIIRCTGQFNIQNGPATIGVRAEMHYVNSPTTTPLSGAATASRTDATRYNFTIDIPVNASRVGPGVNDTGYVKVGLATAVTGTKVDISGQTGNFTIRGYRDPSISLFTAKRANSSNAPDDTGPNVIYSVTSAVYQFGSGSSLANVITARYRTRVAGGTWSGYTTVANTGTTCSKTNQSLGAFNQANSYEMHFEVVDSIGTTMNAYSTIPSAKAIMHFRSDGTGIAIGSFSSASNLFEVALPSRFKQPVTIDTPLARSSGGWGMNMDAQANWRAARELLGIHSGVTNISLSGSSTSDYWVAFGKSIPLPLKVVYSMGLPSNVGSIYHCIAYNQTTPITNTGFYLRISPNGSMTARVNWIAISGD